MGLLWFWREISYETRVRFPLRLWALLCHYSSHAIIDNASLTIVPYYVDFPSETYSIT